ncbi:masquerade serine proteinase, partial [Danaus plexippus plexippus]
FLLYYDRVQADVCSSYLDVCCNVPDVRPPDNPITPKPPKFREGCGWRNPDGIGFKTIGDNDGESKFGEFPWMVAILK